MDTLYVSDLDGTLLKNDATLSELSRRELCAMLDEEVRITVASARSIASMKPVLGEIPFRLPVIEGNGAYVSDYATGRHIAINSMKTELAREAFALISEDGLAPLVFMFNGTRDLVYYRDMSSLGMTTYMNERKVYGDDRLTKTEDLGGVVEDRGNRIVSLTMIDSSEAIERFRERVSGRLGGMLLMTCYEYRYLPGWHFLSLHDASATKEGAIGFIRERYSLRGDLVTFGDDDNDVEMVRTATRGVAPSNAKDSVKAVAGQIIGSNEEDSVVRFIREETAAFGTR